MTSLDFVKELVNAFNASNYGSKVNTNFVVEGDNIVVKFNCGEGYAKRYLSQMARYLVREYYSDESVARYAFDLGSFPFHFDEKWLKYDKKTRMTKLTVPIDSGVIFNLKVHFAEEFTLVVKNQVIKAIDEKFHLGKKRIEEILNASIEQVEIDSFSGYIECLLFNSPNLQTYFIGVLQEQIKKHCYNYSGFYDIDDNKVYFKDVENIGLVRSVTETSRKKTAYNFNLRGVGNLKVKAERYKGAIGELIFRLAGVSICGYYRDNFIREDRISNGDRFAFIPMIKEGNNLRYLTHMEADKINAKFSHDILTNIRGQTEATRSNEFGEVYAFSDRQIALLIPVIIENSVINKDGQIGIDPELRFQALSPAQSPFNSPMHAVPSGLRTPPNQRKKDTDSGYDSNSPSKSKNSGAQSSRGGPGPSSKVSQIQLEPPTRSPDGALDGPPRQWSEKEEETGRMVQLLLGEIGQASTSSQQTDMPSSSYTYIDKRDESMPEDSYFLPSMLTSFPHVITPSVRYGIPRRPILLTAKNDQKSSSREFSARSPCFEDVNILGMKSEEHDKSEQGACSQVGVRALEGAQADDESMPIEIRGQQVRCRPSVPYRRRGEMTCRPSSIPFPTAWNNSIFSDLGVSEDSPKDTENICNEEHKEQKVIDKSDQKSSDECSEAKSQESESPKKHGGGVQKIKSFFSSLSKPKQHDASLKRHDVGRDTTRSTPETPVTEKPSVLKAFFSFPGRRKAKSNPPSEVTSPTHEGGPKWQQRLNPDQREELRPLLSPELQKKLDSNSLSPEDEQLKHLLYTPSGQEKMKKIFESQEENLRRSVNAQL